VGVSKQDCFLGAASYPGSGATFVPTNHRQEGSGRLGGRPYNTFWISYQRFLTSLSIWNAALKTEIYPYLREGKPFCSANVPQR
jgi:hypothetical protein